MDVMLFSSLLMFREKTGREKSRRKAENEDEGGRKGGEEEKTFSGFVLLFFSTCNSFIRER